MTNRFSTATRRGLVLTLYSEVLLVMAAIGFLWLPDRPKILVLGIASSGLVGILSGLSFWAGKREFGPAYARAVGRAFGAFAVLLGALLISFFELTSIFPESLRLADLRGPWFFLGIALLADVAAIWILLKPLGAEAATPWLRLAVGVGVLGTVLYFWLGWHTIEAMMARNGSVAFNAAEASSFVHDFVRGPVRAWAGVLLAIRFGFWPALYHALTNVAEAEREAEETSAVAGESRPSMAD